VKRAPDLTDLTVDAARFFAFYNRLKAEADYSERMIERDAERRTPTTLLMVDDDDDGPPAGRPRLRLVR